MKNLLFVFSAFLLAISADTFADDAHFLERDYSAYNFDFVAPVVSSSSTVGANAQTGLIIYDAESTTFKGYAHDGSWRVLGGETPRSMVQVDSGNGHGSTNTKIRRFSNTRVNTGSDITYADSATNGASFTINSNGVYSINYVDRNTAGGEQICITVNASAMTTQCGTPITYAQGFRALGHATTNSAGSTSWTGILAAGDVVRPQTNGNANATDEFATFVVTKVAD